MKKSGFLLLFILFSCTELGDNKPPDDLIPPQQMSNIMLDIILMKNIKSNSFYIKEKENLLADQYLFEKFGIDSLQLASSQAYYAKNPKKYLPIMTEVQEKIQKIQDSLQKRMTEDEE